MTDLQATLAAIDELAVHECGQCRRPLRPDGPSPDFCGPWCQEDWLRAKQEIVELVGYREPCDLPVHAYNLVELSSPETTPAGVYEVTRRLNAVSTLRFTVQFDTTPIMDAFERVVDAMRPFSAAAGQFLTGFSGGQVIFDEIHDWQPLGLEPLRSMSLGFHPEPEPEPCETPELFGADFDFEHRPATTLPDEPPPAVMPALPERDWQALVDARTRGSGPEQRSRAPRQLGRRR